MNYWEIYLKTGKTVDKAIEMLVKDAPEMSEQVSWTLYRLDSETPCARAYHDWQVAKNALGNHVEEINDARKRLIKEPTQENAERFSDALMNSNRALRLAQQVLWLNEYEASRRKGETKRTGFPDSASCNCGCETIIIIVLLLLILNRLGGC